MIRKEGHFLVNNKFNTFYLRLYGNRNMVKDHSDSKRGNLLPPFMGYSFQLATRNCLYASLTERIVHTGTSTFVMRAVEH